jgi:glycolate oxidase
MEKIPRLPKNITKNLKAIVGADHLLTSPPELVTYSYDATAISALPQAVAIVTDPAQVAPIVKLCGEHCLPLIPRGAGSGFSGGTVPIAGGLVLVLAQLTSCSFEFGPPPHICAQPGALTSQVQALAKEHGYFYPPDPASQEFSTIGGNIAVGAGGPHGLKYGTTRDYVLGLDLVLPDGSEVSAERKGAGDDLLELVIGSEGTLAVIVGARLRLLPLPTSSASLMLAFADQTSAIRCVQKMVACGLTPARLEFMDRFCLQAVGEYMASPLPTEGSALLLEEDGEPGDVSRLLDRCAKLARQMRAKRILLAEEGPTQDQLWEARNAISPALARYGPTKVNEDICVPIDRLAETLTGLSSIARKQRVFVANFGHAGDGNIHINFIGDRRRPQEMARINQAVEEVFALVLKMGGTITGEHGEALTKQKYLPQEVSPLATALYRKVKQALDPQDIFNPGKIFSLQNPA